MTIAFLLLFAFHITGFASSIHAVMSTRTPQGAIAWGVFLNTFPYLAVPSYWVLGRNKFQGYVIAKRDSEDELSRLVNDVRENLKPFHYASTDTDFDENNSVANRLTGIPFMSGNEVRLLTDGVETFDSILDGIDSAKNYILFQFYIVKDDEIGRTVKRHLIAKAESGIDIYFLYDEIGSHDLPDSFLEELRSAGVSVSAFNTRKGPSNRFQINFRNHRKLVITDGQHAWIGGHNVGDEYLGRDPRFGHWRDTHIRISGPAVIEAQISFLEDWHWATNDLFELDWTARRYEADIPILIAPTGPADELETASLLFTHAINAARNRIWIASPYFVPDEAVMQALQLASTRGVDVRILIPDKRDHWGAYLAAYTYQARASGTGVRFFRYTDGFMHQKVVLQDDLISAIGTANFDNRSFRLNFEITSIMANKEIAQQIETMLMDDLENSIEMEPGALASKPFWFRLAANLARLTAPIQ